MCWQQAVVITPGLHNVLLMLWGHRMPEERSFGSCFKAEKHHEAIYINKTPWHISEKTRRQSLGPEEKDAFGRLCWEDVTHRAVTTKRQYREENCLKFYQKTLRTSLPYDILTRKSTGHEYSDQISL